MTISINDTDIDDICIYKGKVRDVYKKKENHLIIDTTDRVSSFNKHIGNIPGKGILLNKICEYWFNNTHHIIPNHMLSICDSRMLVKKCKPFMVEVIVRGYITGNTDTSLWVNYNNGCRNYCGNILPEGLVKNQKLDEPIITPTTKGEVDIPISKEQIILDNLMTKEECDYIYLKAMELFKYGQKIAELNGFILVDTKYEFGKTIDDSIVLIDEVHTCDSSRYWIKDTYDDNFKNGIEPDKLDKDIVRDWVKSQCNPYEDNIPELPSHIIDKAYNNYKYFYDKISTTNNTLKPYYDYSSGNYYDTDSFSETTIYVVNRGTQTIFKPPFLFNYYDFLMDNILNFFDNTINILFRMKDTSIFMIKYILPI